MGLVVVCKVRDFEEEDIKDDIQFLPCIGDWVVGFD